MMCHLDNNRFLHEYKYRDFMLNEPVNLAGLHRIKVNDGNGRCIDCHREIGIIAEMKYAIKGELFDLMKYLYNPEEPVSLYISMPDKNCLYCHEGISKVKKINGFHYYNAHKGVMPIQCIECHVNHDNNVKSGYFFVNKEKTLNICSRCHRGLSERITGALVKSSNEQ